MLGPALLLNMKSLALWLSDFSISLRSFAVSGGMHFKQLIKQYTYRYLNFISALIIGHTEVYVREIFANLSYKST